MKKTLRAFRAFSLKAILIALLLVTFTTLPNYATEGCDCDHVITPPASRTTSVFIDGENLGVKPGQTICLKSGFYMQIRFTRVSGTPGMPVTIKNCDGLVEIGDSTNFGRWYAVDMIGCKYIRFTGTGNWRHKYGIKLGKSGDSGLKIGGLSTQTEIDHLEIGNTGFAGILAKTDFGGKPPLGAPEMNNVNIHDNYIHDTQGEGMYIGETKTPGQNFRHLEIWNNIVTRTGLELVQVANCVEDVKVHHNVLHTGGLRNVLYQNKGFQIGDNSVGNYYNNFIIGSPSNPMIVMGSGDIKIFKNYMQGSGEPGFFIDNRSVTIPEPIIILNNYIMDINETVPFLQVYNEINPVLVIHNAFDGNNALLTFGSGAGPNVKDVVNTRKDIAEVEFTDIANDNFVLKRGSPYRGIGLLEYQDIERNERPFIDIIPDQQMEINTEAYVKISADDPDGEEVYLKAFNLPSFVTFHQVANGRGKFAFAPSPADTGIFYNIRVRATDIKGAMNTQSFTLTVKAHQGNPAPLSAETVFAASSSEAFSETLVGNPAESYSGAISVFPNPMTDKLTVDLGPGHGATVGVEITDDAGTLFYQNQFTYEGRPVELNLGSAVIPPGMYLVRIKSDGQHLDILRFAKY